MSIAPLFRIILTKRFYRDSRRGVRSNSNFPKLPNWGASTLKLSYRGEKNSPARKTPGGIIARVSRCGKWQMVAGSRDPSVQRDRWRLKNRGAPRVCHYKSTGWMPDENYDAAISRPLRPRFSARGRLIFQKTCKWRKMVEDDSARLFLWLTPLLSDRFKRIFREIRTLLIEKYFSFVFLPLPFFLLNYVLLFDFFLFRAWRVSSVWEN